MGLSRLLMLKKEAEFLLFISSFLPFKEIPCSSNESVEGDLWHLCVMIIPGLQPSTVSITSLHSRHISHSILKTTAGCRQGGYCPILWTRNQSHLSGEPDPSHLMNCYWIGSRTLIFLLPDGSLSFTVLYATEDRQIGILKWLCLRNCSYNPSWLAADLLEAISSLLMLFHIKQVWEWVIWLAQSSRAAASARLETPRPPLPGGSKLCARPSCKTAAALGPTLCSTFAISSFVEHSLMFPFHAFVVWYSVLFCSHALPTELSVKQGTHVGCLLPAPWVGPGGGGILSSLRREFGSSASSCLGLRFRLLLVINLGARKCPLLSPTDLTAER